jgi:hypothetical protein
MTERWEFEIHDAGHGLNEMNRKMRQNLQRFNNLLKYVQNVD